MRSLFDARRDAPRLRGHVVRMRGHLAVRCPGPGHSHRDDSLVVIEAPRDPEGFITTSHAGDHWASCRDHVREILGGGRFEPRRTRPPVPARRKPENEHQGSDDDTAGALAIWEEAVDPGRTPVEGYLAHRAVLEAARPAFGDALRFHPRCPFGPGVRTPCLIGLVRDIRSDKPVAILRTALSREGRNVAIGGRKRMALGPTAGGAVKLKPDAEVTLAIAVAEGIETTLSLRLVPDLATMPVWALLSSAGVAAFPVLAGVEAIWLAVDNDSTGAGQEAAAACARRWTDAGREALRLVPIERGDLNDLARGAAPCRST